MLGAGFFFANGGNTDAICQEGFRRPRGLSSSTLNRLCVKDAWHVSGSYYLNETYEVGLIHQQVRYQNNPTHRGTGFSLTRAVPDSKNSSYMHYTYTDNRGGRVGKSHYLLVGVDRGISKNLVAFAELDFDRTKTSEVKSEAITGTLGLAFRF